MLTLIDYTEKSCVVYSKDENIEEYKDFLNELGGKYNYGLTIDGKKTPGFVFMKYKKNIIEKELKNCKKGNTVKPQEDNRLLISGLATRVENLDARIGNIENIIGLPSNPETSSDINQKVTNMEKRVHKIELATSKPVLHDEIKEVESILEEEEEVVPVYSRRMASVPK